MLLPQFHQGNADNRLRIFTEGRPDLPSPGVNGRRLIAWAWGWQERSTGRGESWSGASAADRPHHTRPTGSMDADHVTGVVREPTVRSSCGWTSGLRWQRRLSATRTYSATPATASPNGLAVAEHVPRVVRLALPYRGALSRGFRRSRPGRHRAPAETQRLQAVRHTVSVLQFIKALFHRERPPAPHLEGEAYEILKADRQREEQRRRSVESAAEKMSHLSFPFKKDPFD